MRQAELQTQSDPVALGRHPQRLHPNRGQLPFTQCRFLLLLDCGVFCSGQQWRLHGLIERIEARIVTSLGAIVCPRN
jgi:hypothetical protein